MKECIGFVHASGSCHKSIGAFECLSVMLFNKCFWDKYPLSNRRLEIVAAFNPLPDDKILDCSKLKQVADDILKCM